MKVQCIISCITTYNILCYILKNESKCTFIPHWGKKCPEFHQGIKLKESLFQLLKARKKKEKKSILIHLYIFPT